MRKLIICIAIVVTFTVTAYAQTGSATNEGQQNPMTGCGCSKMQQMQSHRMMQGTQQMPMEQSMMGEGQKMPMMNCPKMQQMQGQGMMQGGQQMPMMQMCMPMMQHMMGQNLLAKDMMYMMTDIMKMQKKIISDVSPSEKKETLKELDKMMEKMDSMMSDMRCSCKMMGGMMELPAEPAKKVQEKEEPMQKVVPKTDPHGH